MSDLINTIQNSIETGKCVLVLGPDLYIKEINGSVIERKQYFSEIEKEISSCIYFPNEDIFDIHKDDRVAVGLKVKDFYTAGGDIKLFELISSIKFPLILNASPDSSLKDFCLSNGIPLSFDFFEGEIDEKKEVCFSIEKPLLYNVFGNAKDLREIILDYKRLFNHIQKIIPENSFPLSIRSFLSNATCFIFLGFKFDSWAFQLLSHKILSHKPHGSKLDEERLQLSPSELDKIKLGKIKTDRINNQIKSNNISKESLVNIIMSSSVGMEFTDITPAQLITNVSKTLKERGLNEFIRDVKNQEKYSSFLSYAHPNKNDSTPNIGNITKAFINSFETKRADNDHLKIVYDVEELHFGQSIDSFMTRIGKGKTVVLIISDKYLKSFYCMTEAKRIFRYNNNDERIFAIVVKDSLSTKEEYESHWKKQALCLVENHKNKLDDITNALEFSNEIPDFFAKMNNLKYLEINLSDLQKGNDGEVVLKENVQKNLDAFTIDLISKLKE